MENMWEFNDLIYKMRVSKGLTQKQVGEILCVSDKTISNWETHRTPVAGDAIFKLKEALNIDANAFKKEFSVFLEPDNLIYFYMCPICKSITWSRKYQHTICCNHKINPLTPKHSDDEHYLHLEYQSYLGCNEITSMHEMTPTHHIEFVAYVSKNSVIIFDNLPFESITINVPKILNQNSIYFYCSKHGLFRNKLNEHLMY